MAEQIVLVDQAGTQKVALDADDAVEITNWRARGYATQEAWDSVKRAEKEAAEEAADYTKWNKDKLEAEVASRNQSRAADDLVVVAEPGNKREIIAALQADDETREGDQ